MSKKGEYGVNNQHWEPTVWTKKAADRSDKRMEAHAKSGGGKNTISATDVNMRKLDETEKTKHDTVPLEIRTQIQRKRAELGWSQQQLAQRLNLKKTVINEIESGKHIMNKQLLSRVKRVLKL